MKDENQIIGFVKWLFKWLLIVILGLIVLALGIWGATYAYEYWTNDRHLKNVEVVVFDGSLYESDDIIGQHRDINLEEMFKIYFKSGSRSAYREAVDKLLEEKNPLEQKKINMALNNLIFKEMKRKLEIAVPQIKEMRSANFPEEHISEYKESLGVTDKMLEDAQYLLSYYVPSTLCSDDTPLFVFYRNRSSKTIDFIRIELSGFLPKRSSNILSYPAAFESDYLLEPSDSRAECTAARYENDFVPQDARYEGKVSRAQFGKD